MKLLAATLVILALFGASTQCVAECLTPVKVPPCHRHAQGQDKSPADSCRHPQWIAQKQPLTDQAIAVPADVPFSIELTALFWREVPLTVEAPAGIGRPPTVLRL